MFSIAQHPQQKKRTAKKKKKKKNICFYTSKTSLLLKKNPTENLGYQRWAECNFLRHFLGEYNHGKFIVFDNSKL